MTYRPRADAVKSHVAKSKLCKIEARTVRGPPLDALRAQEILALQSHSKNVERTPPKKIVQRNSHRKGRGHAGRTATVNLIGTVIW